MIKNHAVTITTETITGRTAGGAPVVSVTTSTVYGQMVFNTGKLSYVMGGDDKQVNAIFFTDNSAATGKDKLTFNGVDYKPLFENTVHNRDGNAIHYEINLQKMQ